MTTINFWDRPACPRQPVMADVLPNGASRGDLVIRHMDDKTRKRDLPVEAMFEAVGASGEALSRWRRAMLEHEPEALLNPYQHLCASFDGPAGMYADEVGKGAALSYVRMAVESNDRQCSARAILVELSRSVTRLDRLGRSVGGFELARAKALARVASAMLEHADGVIFYNG